MKERILREDISYLVGMSPFLAALGGKMTAVTGATGLSGACMVRCLLVLRIEKGINLQVVAVIRNVQKTERTFGQISDEISYYSYDFSCFGPFTPTKKTDYISHFAASTASRDFVEYSVETMNTAYGSTQNLLSYTHQYGVISMVLASTLEAYDTVADDRRPLTGGVQGYLDLMTTRSSYPLAKRAAEALCHNYADEYGVHVKVARLTRTFGTGVNGNDNRVSAQFVRSVMKDEDIILHTTGELCRCYYYTIDAAMAMLYILSHGKDGEVYNVANEDIYISTREMAELVASTFNPRRVKVVIQPQEGLGYSPTTKFKLATQYIQESGWKPYYGLKEMSRRPILPMEEEQA